MQKKKFYFQKLGRFVSFICFMFGQWLFANSDSALNLDPAYKFDVVTVVWGKDFTEAFLKVALPLQLCPGNIGSLPFGQARYRIFTTSDDWETMQSHPNMKKLHELISVEFVNIIELHPYTSYRYLTLNACHRQAISNANQKGRALFFLSPDILISNQAFRTVLHYIQEGKRAVVIMNPRTRKEIMVPLIEDILKEDKFQKNGLDSRYLVKLSMAHLHPQTELTCCNNPQILECASHIFWKLDDENLLGYGYHLHPFFIWPETDVENRSAVDCEYISDACPSQEKWKLIEDSDELYVAEFSDSLWHSELGWMNCDPFNVAMWGVRHATRPHHWYFYRPVYFRSSDYKAEWKVIEDQASEFIRAVKKYAGR